MKHAKMINGAMLAQAETSRSLVTPTALLRVRMLGPPEIEWIDQPLTIPRRQVRALLFHLATRLKPVPREQLCDLFWPDHQECTARRNLSHLLTHLRHSLPIPEVLQIVDDHIALDPHKTWSDTTTFKHLYSTAMEAQYCLKTLQQAASLYRGSFLVGFSLATSPQFELWITSERSIWERLHLEALAALVQEELTEGNYQAAIDYAQRYLAIDDLAEEMHCRLITLYATIGDRTAAMRQFENCKVALERQLGVSPLPKTRLAYQTVLEGRLQLVSYAKPPPTWTTLPSLDVPLVGRDQALDCLKRVYACVRSRQSQVVLISGEPGSGKSRLVQDFVTKFADSEATIVVGGGHEAERSLPYWPLVEALYPYVPHLGQVSSSIAPVHLAELARLWPELQIPLPDLLSPLRLEPGHERGRLFQALVAWLLSLAAQNPPLILCLDDLHWADEATLSWLSYLTRQLMHTPIMVIGTYRREEEAALDALRTELMRLGRLQEIRLSGLSQAEVRLLVRHLLGQPSKDERLSQRLYRETGGNPFFLLETLRAMFEAGTLWQDETGSTFADADEFTADDYELPLPETVGEAIRFRLTRLSPQSRQILEAGAVVGHCFSFELVRATSGCNDQEVVEALDALLHRQVIVEYEGRYRFKHNFIRTVVYGDLSYGRRRLLQQRAQKVLENYGSTSQPSWPGTSSRQNKRRT